VPAAAVMGGAGGGVGSASAAAAAAAGAWAAAAGAGGGGGEQRQGPLSFTVRTQDLGAAGAQWRSFLEARKFVQRPG